MPNNNPIANLQSGEHILLRKRLVLLWIRIDVETGVTSFRVASRTVTNINVYRVI